MASEVFNQLIKIGLQSIYLDNTNSNDFKSNRVFHDDICLTVSSKQNPLVLKNEMLSKFPRG